MRKKTLRDVNVDGKRVLVLSPYGSDGAEGA